MNAIALTGLIKMVLPSRTVRWCDGGFFEYESEIYRDQDDVFGTVGAVQTLSEGVGNSVPALVMTVLPPSTSAVSDISQPGNQTSPVTFSIAEFDVDSGLITTGDTQFLGQIDQTVFTLGKDRRELTVSVVSLAERVVDGNIGNSLKSTFHKSIWAGETGEDNATGLGVPVAWGTDKPTSGASGAGGGSGGNGDSFYRGRNLRAY